MVLNKSFSKHPLKKKKKKKKALGDAFLPLLHEISFLIESMNHSNDFSFILDHLKGIHRAVWKK